ncbi:MAG: hypothetical protein ACFNTB_06080, partial [Prevotella denticola]
VQRHRCAVVALGVILSMAVVSCADESMTEGEQCCRKSLGIQGISYLYGTHRQRGRDGTA